MNIQGFETILNDNGFAKQENRAGLSIFKTVLSNFKNTGIQTDIHLYFNQLNNHVLITSLTAFSNKSSKNEKTIFSGRAKDKEEFEQLLKMLYIKQ